MSEEMNRFGETNRIGIAVTQQRKPQVSGTPPMTPTRRTYTAHGVTLVIADKIGDSSNRGWSCRSGKVDAPRDLIAG
jgi:hypothetical protein